MKRVRENKLNFVVSKKQVLASFLGNFIISAGIVILRISCMGNDPYSAMAMTMSAYLGIGLGVFQIILSAVLITIEYRFGKSYIGVGTVVNMFLLGYFIQFNLPILQAILGEEGSHTMSQRILIMILGLLVISLGAAIYQKVDAGVAPYDYLSLGITDHAPTPYFLNRIATDAVCALVALSPWFLGFISFEDGYIGIGTIVIVAVNGPLIQTCDKFIVSKFWKE